MIDQTTGASPPPRFLSAHLPFQRGASLWCRVGIGGEGERTGKKEGRQIGGIERFESLTRVPGC